MTDQARWIPPTENRHTGGPHGAAAAVLYPTVYPWYVLMSAMDVMITWVILLLGGRELNVLADWIIRNYDLPGTVAYKFVLMMFVVGVCEVVGRRRYHTGLSLARWAVVLSTFPVMVGLVHLLAFALDSLA